MAFVKVHRLDFKAKQNSKTFGSVNCTVKPTDRIVQRTDQVVGTMKYPVTTGGVGRDYGYLSSHGILLGELRRNPYAYLEEALFGEELFWKEPFERRNVWGIDLSRNKLSHMNGIY